MSLFEKETQNRFIRVAGKMKKGIPLEGKEEILIGEIMEEHPEFTQIWELGDLSAAPHEINGQVVNPFVHTALHLSLELQVDKNEPEEVMEVFQKMMKKGTDRHEVIHQIGGIYASVYFTTFRRGQSFEETSYIELVRELVEE